MTTAGLCGARRNSAPVKAPMKGTPASVAIGCVAAEVGVPTGPIEREHLVVVEKAAGRLDRPLRLVAVVPADELELAALDAAGPVHLAERGKQALPHAEPKRRGRTLEHGRLAEHDPVGKDAVVAGEHRRRQGHGDDAEHGSGRPPRTHC